MCYTYDNLSRVVKRTVKDLCDNVISEESFSYDAAGNITDAPDSCFQYDVNNRLTSFCGNTVTYDLDGNMLSNGTQSFVYDSSNRLTWAGGHEYTYNAENVRIVNHGGGHDTTYTYNTNCRLSQLLMKSTDFIVTKYVYGLGLIGEEKLGCFKTYHFDMRGSTVAITDMCGNVIDTFKYDTYGKVTEHIGNSFVIFGYNGRDGVVTDKNGLIYMRARYYSPVMKRFVNADILHGTISDSTSLNRYSYVNGNPVSFVDPFGLASDYKGPTSLEAAYMAQHIYNATEEHINVNLGEKFGGWKLSYIYVNDEGLKIGVYYKTTPEGITSYTIANAGSEINVLKDPIGVYNDWIKNNFTQPFGNSNDMKDSIYFATDFAKKHPGASMTFVGHSKGGAEAVANAVATNSNAIVFNPARAKFSEYDLSTENYKGSVTSYIVDGEILDTVSDGLSGILGENIGVEITLNASFNEDVTLPQDGPGAQAGQALGKFILKCIKHSIGTVIDALN